MKIYVIMQKETEYNDEYDAPQEGGKIYKAFLTKPTKEQLDAAKWGAIEDKQCDIDGWPSDMAYVEEIEVDESQVVQPGEVQLATTKPPQGPVVALKLATYAEAQARAAQARVEAAAMAKGAIEMGIKAIFDQYPDLEEFSWDQYAPYFNDGDPCEFSVHSDYPEVKLKGFELEEGTPEVLYSRVDGSDKVYVLRKDSDGSGYSVFYSYGKRGSSLVEGKKCHAVSYGEAQEIINQVKEEKIKEGYGCPYDDIHKFLSGIDEDDMKAVFGADCTVTATRDGTETDECSHD